MAFTSKLNYRGMFDVTEIGDTTSLPLAASTGLYQAFDALNLLVLLEDLEDVAAINLTSDGDDTFDLTAMPLARDYSQTKDFTGKKLVAAAFKAGTTNNAAGMVIKSHATNGFPIFGTDNDRFTIFPGSQLMFAPAQASTLYGTAVGGSDKIIHITGTNLDTLKALLLFT